MTEPTIADLRELRHAARSDYPSFHHPWRDEDDSSFDRDCRPRCAARRNPNAECVCAELDRMGVPR